MTEPTPAKKAAAKRTSPEPTPNVVERTEPDPPVVAPPIAVALSSVMAEVRSVGKDSQAPGNIGGYRFRGVDAVVNAVGPALRRHGVVVMPEVLDVERNVTQSKAGAPMMNVYVRTRFTFYGPAGDSLACTVLGEAADAGDKATAKAQSVALRVALLQALCLPTDETDPDAEGYERGAHQAPPVNPDPPVERNPEGVPYFLPDGKPNPDALAPHQRQVWDQVAALEPDVAAQFMEWARANSSPWRYITEDQAHAALDHLRTLVAKRPPA